MMQVASRNRELALLILGLIIGAGALALTAAARGQGDVSVAAPYITVFVIGYVATHITIRKIAAAADPLLLPLVGVINAIGITAVYRLSEYRAWRDVGPAQLTWVLVGLGFFVATLFVVRDVHVLARFKYIAGFSGVGLLLLPLAPGIGREINGAQLWVDIGPLNFQPGELSKILLVVFFAGYLAERKELLSIASRRVLGVRVPDLKHFGPLLVMWGLSLAVMFYLKDLGSSLLFFSIFLVMIYIATARSVYVATGVGLFGLGAYLGYRAFDHVQLRVATWLDVFNPDYIQDESYQLARSLFALSAGGLFGTGLGRGRPDLVPEAHTDFIFSVVGHELGLIGAAGILLCFLLLVGRGFRIALTARNDFAQLLAAGLTTILGVQTFIILAGVTRLLPLTGITLPFMSYGGSSLLANFILVALLLRTSHQIATERPAEHTAEILIGGRR